MATSTALAPRTASIPVLPVAAVPPVAAAPVAAAPAAGPPPWTPRTAAGERAVRRRRARITADRRPPSGVLPSTNRTAVSVSADRGCDVDEARFRMGRWARLATTVTLLAACVIVGAVLLSAGPSPVISEVIVGQGDSLWSIAQRAEPGADPRSVVNQIMQLNALDGESIVAGAVLKVPTLR